MFLVNGNQPGVINMRIFVIGFGMLFGGNRTVKFILQFWNFERGQKLPRLHLVAEIHVHFLYITGNLGVQLQTC